jgi:S-adenosylmethionine synthetase
MGIHVNINGDFPESQPIEYVERKGKGHPDTLIDGIVERASMDLSREYINEMGSILHHNVDKGLIVGGESEATFGKGRITKAIEVIVAGRATKSVEGKNFDIDGIVRNSARNYLKENTRFLDIDKEVEISTKIQKGSADLSSVFKSRGSAPRSNDTSFGIGFAPFSETERLVLETELYLNSKEYKKRMPAVGEDIKIMGIREEGKITLTIAIAFVAEFVKSLDEYIDYKKRVIEDATKFASGLTKKEVEIMVNTADSHSANEVYLTKSGLSCEAGDDGSVGRGNRVNGLITPFRHMTLEAAYGKNPINHVGKIYSIISNEIAKDVVNQYEDIKNCTVYIVSQIGMPINSPKNLNVELALDDAYKKDFGKLNEMKIRVADLAEDHMKNIAEFSRDFISGKYNVVP